MSTLSPRASLYAQMVEKGSVLCVGLDTDIRLLPSFLRREKYPVRVFNQRIIDATHPYSVAYKFNTAFYESRGSAGWADLEASIAMIPPNCLTIADAKRGDIGNTAKHYARAFFETLQVDAITLSPYMGKDTLTPFLDYTNKWSIVLGLTSNAGAQDIQCLLTQSGIPLYQQVMAHMSQWASPDHVMFVVGGTHKEPLRRVRSLLPDHVLLVPGVGAQGGDLDEILKIALTPTGKVLINLSRALIYADDSAAFQRTIEKKAKDIQTKMAQALSTAANTQA